MISYLSLGFEIEIPIVEVFFLGFGMTGEFSANTYLWKPDPTDLANKSSPGLAFDTSNELVLAATLMVSGAVGIDAGIASVKVGMKGKGTVSRYHQEISRNYLATVNPRYKQDGTKYEVKAGLYAFAKVSFLCFEAGVEWRMIE